jgi:hypothetical protein
MTRTSLAWLLAAATFLGASASARAETPVERARRLGDAFLAGWLARHPEEATRLGEHSSDGRLPLLARAACANDAVWYAARRESLAAISDAALPPATRVDLGLLRARAEHEWRVLSAERLNERDPGFYLAPLARALFWPARGRFASPCSRTVRLRSRLRAVPEYLRDARLALVAPSRVCTEAAIDQAEELLAMCRASLPFELEDCRDARLQADLAEADSLATSALTEFLGFLRDVALPRADATVPIDAEGLKSRLESVAGRAVSLDSMLTRARAELAALPEDESVGGFSRRAPGTRPLNPGRDDAIALAESLRTALIRAAVVPPPGDLHVELTEPAGPVGESVAALVPLGPWDSGGGRNRLDLGPWWTTWNPSDSLAWRADLGLRLAAEAFPGRVWFTSRPAPAPSRWRQAFGLEAVLDGWSRYAESLWVESLAGAARERAARRAARYERERLARTIAELRLRVERAPLDEVARELEQSAAFGPEQARRAAQAAAAAPRWAAATLALWDFRELRARAASGIRADRYHGALAAEGAIPAAWRLPVAAKAAGDARPRNP